MESSARLSREIFHKNNEVFLICFLCIVFSFITITPIVALIVLRKESNIDELTTYGIAHVRQLSGDWT